MDSRYHTRNHQYELHNGPTEFVLSRQFKFGMRCNSCEVSARMSLNDDNVLENYHHSVHFQCTRLVSTNNRRNEKIIMMIFKPYWKIPYLLYCPNMQLIVRTSG